MMAGPAIGLGAAACSFGVDLENLVGGGSGDGGIDVIPIPIPTEGGTDGTVIATVDLEQIAAGSTFTCVRRSTGTVACWGRGTEGRLGDSLATSRSSPADVRDLPDAIDLAVGMNHACAIRKGGAIYCWGQNDVRQLGNGTTNEARTPVPTVGVGNALRLSAGLGFTCAILEDRTVSCWGDNGQGQLGAGDTAAHPGPVVVTGLREVKELATTVTAACALTNAGEVYCWGDNEDGQSGSGDAGGADLSAPRKVESLAGVTSLSVGSTADHLCAVLAGGEVKCWGYNDTGSLGTGVPGDSPVPVSVTTLKDIVGVATGTGYSLAVHADGTVSAWGANSTKQLAIGESGLPATTNTPVTAQGLEGVTQIGAGASHACALKGKREVLCWGTDVYGALGRKRMLTSNVPVKVASAVELKAIASGRSHACGIDGAKGVRCWGDNGARQLGRGDVALTGVPAPVASLGDVAKIAASDAQTCSLLGDGGVRCWGAGDTGALGNGVNAVQVSPVPFTAPQAIDVATGSSFTCALLKNGNVSCAGAAADGRLGSPGTTTSTPRLVLAPPDGGVATPPAFQGVSALAVGRLHACVIHNAGKSVACWGGNDSNQLGRTGGSSANASDVPMPKAPIQVACGFRHTCARLTGNQTICWGRNTNGQVTGPEPTSATQRTVTFPGGHFAADLSLGDDHSCALLDDGTVACWGAGALGQLGNGQSTDASQPVLVTGVAGATAISAEENHTCAVTPTGTFCWGTDFSGQLGVAPLMVTGVPLGVEGL